MTAITQHEPVPSTFAERFGTGSLSGYCRAARATMLAMFDVLPIGRRTPREIAKLKSDIQGHKTKPVEHLLKYCFAAIDAGVSLQRVLALIDELRQAIEHYAQRRERRMSAGVLPFKQVFARLHAKSCLEEGQANAAIAELDENDPASIDRAMQETQDDIAADRAELERLGARKAELLASR